MLKRMVRLLACVLLVLALAGCGSREQPPSVVATVFPEYDWARQILGEDSPIQLHLLVDNGVDAHSFQPTVGDMVRVYESDLLIYIGGESDEWAEEAAGSGRLLRLMDVLEGQLHIAEVTEGMMPVREEEEEFDEHIWLSLRKAAVCCRAIAEEIIALDPANEAVYRSNLEAYLQKLTVLDEAYTRAVSGSGKQTLLFADRFPFRYLVEDYGLQYYAAFPGCSSESGASFATIVFLAERMKALELDAVLVLEGADGRLAATVAENSGRQAAEILILDSMQAISSKDGRSYLDIMEKNLSVLQTALS